MNQRTRERSPNAPADIPKMPKVKCKEWCEYGNGHPNEHQRADQWCGSKQMTIDLHHIQPAANPANEFQDNYLVTYVMQAPGGGPVGPPRLW